jgi:glycogen synthase
MADVLRAGLGRFRSQPAAAALVRQHAAGFSWAATAEGYARVYEQALRDPAVGAG